VAAPAQEAFIMATLFVRHHVTDYAKWRAVYDGFAPTLKKFGVQAATVYQSADDPRDLTVTHEFASLDAARAFTGSPELREAMHSAGVEGAPTTWFATRA
jgi:hypothetical protein